MSPIVARPTAARLNRRTLLQGTAAAAGRHGDMLLVAKLISPDLRDYLATHTT